MITAPFLFGLVKDYAFAAIIISLNASTFTLPVLTRSTPLSTIILLKPGVL